MTEKNLEQANKTSKQKTSGQKPELSISVRRLAELLYRRGGLAPAIYGGVEGIEGIRAHQKALRLLAASETWGSYEFSPEYSLSTMIEGENYHLLLRGRADLILHRGDETVIAEIKSFRGKADFIPDEGVEVHWAQAELYAGLLAAGTVQIDDSKPGEQGYNELLAAGASTVADNDHRQGRQNHHELLAVDTNEAGSSAHTEPGQFKLLLVYVSVDEDFYLEKTKILAAEEALKFCQHAATAYLERISNLILWQQRRDASLRSLRFPYEKLRSGQENMMRESLACLRDKGVLFVQAPTGIGKTMAVLYAALKGLSAGYVKRLFYATAMRSTRLVVEAALRDLREAGALIRSLTLKPKEDLCLAPQLFCDQSLCPYALNYYDRLPDAISELLKVEELSPERISETARRHELCPFELSLDMAFTCDVIIGDYNHVFDPRIRLRRFFDEESEAPVAILIDEAHNLPRRSRSMYSASLSSKSLEKLLALFSGESAPFRGFFTKLSDQTQVLLARIKSTEELMARGDENGAPLFPLDENPLVTESERKNWFVRPDFLGLQKKPDRLILELGHEIFLLRNFLDEQRSFEGRQEILLIFFELLHFHRIAEDKFNDAYICAGRIIDGKFQLWLLCLEASGFITEIYRDLHPIIFFSATLSPFPYYEALLCADRRENPPLKLFLPSPFPAENRLLLISTAVSLKYEERDRSIGKVCRMILDACSRKTGNYLIFCPSFAYLDKLRRELKSQIRPEKTDFLLQARGMSERQKQAFLNRFEHYGERSLLAFAVLGSLFNEGIDLVGERLSGLIILGVGLPGLSPERNLMAGYCEEKFGSGFLFSYIFPAFNRIEQAMGRLIRSESDRGFVLLIDKRWSQSPYAQLIPEDWKPRFLDENENPAADIAAFWEDCKDL